MINITSPNCRFHAPQPWPVPVAPYRCCDFWSVTARSNIAELLDVVSTSIHCNLESSFVKVTWESAHLTNQCLGVDGSQSRAAGHLNGCRARAQSPTPPRYSTTESSTQTINTIELFYTAIFLVDYLFTASCCTLSSPSSLSVSDLVETF